MRTFTNLLQAESTISITWGNAPPQNHVASVTNISPLPECLDVSDADIIIQSSDSTNFRVHKSILISSSQLFRDMLSLPQPSNNEIVDGLPVVRVSEDADLIRALVTVLYPIPPELPASYERVLALLSAAQKYDMTTVQSSIRAEVIRRGLPAPTGAHTFRAFVIAFTNKLSPEIGNAARLTLDYPLTFEALGEELQLFEGLVLRELASFRKKCRDSLISCLESFLDTRIGPSKIWVGCPSSRTIFLSYSPDGSLIGQSIEMRPRDPSASVTLGPSHHESTIPSWLHDFFTKVIRKLKRCFTRALPNRFAILKKFLAALLEHCSNSGGCPKCMIVYVRDGWGYWLRLVDKLAQARDQASYFDKT